MKARALLNMCFRGWLFIAQLIMLAKKSEKMRNKYICSHLYLKWNINNMKSKKGTCNIHDIEDVHFL